METMWVVLVTVLLASPDAQTEYVFHAEEIIETDYQTKSGCETFSQDLHALARMEIVEKFQMATKCKKITAPAEEREYLAAFF